MWSQHYTPEQLKALGVDYDMVDRFQQVGYALVERLDLNGSNDIYIRIRDFTGRPEELTTLDATVEFMHRCKMKAPLLP